MITNCQLSSFRPSSTSSIALHDLFPDALPTFPMRNALELSSVSLQEPAASLPRRSMSLNHMRPTFGKDDTLHTPTALADSRRACRGFLEDIWISRVLTFTVPVA